MILDTETLTTLSSADRLKAVTKYLKSMPLAQRPDALETVQRGLDRRETARLKYSWELHARPSQLPPKDDWNTWLILAGRGFGKTRTGAEWVRAQVGNGQAGRIALVARTLPEAQSIMVDGESAIINVSPPWNKPIYEPSKTCPELVEGESSHGPTAPTPLYSQATNPTSCEAHSSTPPGATSSHLGSTQARPGTTSRSPCASDADPAQ